MRRIESRLLSLSATPAYPFGPTLADLTHVLTAELFCDALGAQQSAAVACVSGVGVELDLRPASAAQEPVGEQRRACFVADFMNAVIVESGAHRAAMLAFLDAYDQSLGGEALNLDLESGAFSRSA